MSPPSKKKQASLWGTIALLALMAAVYYFEHRSKGKDGGTPTSPSSERVPRTDTDPKRARAEPDNAAILRMHDQRAHEKWVEGASIVVKVLPDDLEGSRHQRFLIRISKDVRVKVAHNIDLAPRLPVRAGDLVEYRGKYVWNDLGGALHWTHHDPRKRNRGGWLRHEGKVYE